MEDIRSVIFLTQEIEKNMFYVIMAWLYSIISYIVWYKKNGSVGFVNIYQLLNPRSSIRVDCRPTLFFCLTPRGARRQLVAKSVFFALLGHKTLPLVKMTSPDHTLIFYTDFLRYFFFQFFWPEVVISINLKLDHE